jgi:hypothetical protein
MTVAAAGRRWPPLAAGRPLSRPPCSVAVSRGRGRAPWPSAVRRRRWPSVLRAPCWPLSRPPCWPTAEPSAAVRGRAGRAPCSVLAVRAPCWPSVAAAAEPSAANRYHPPVRNIRQ